MKHPQARLLPAACHGQPALRLSGNSAASRLAGAGQAVQAARPGMAAHDTRFALRHKPPGTASG